MGLVGQVGGHSLPASPALPALPATMRFPNDENVDAPARPRRGKLRYSRGAAAHHHASRRAVSQAALSRRRRDLGIRRHAVALEDLRRGPEEQPQSAAHRSGVVDHRLVPKSTATTDPPYAGRHGHDGHHHRRGRGLHSEPYGYFSVDPPEFAAQFKSEEHPRAVSGRRGRRTPSRARRSA